MKVKYSAIHFKRNYDKLPLAIQRRFFFIDSYVCKGDLSKLTQQGWMYFVNLDSNHAAWGSLKEDGKVFFWRYIGGREGVPVIL